MTKPRTLINVQYLWDLAALTVVAFHKVREWGAYAPPPPSVINQEGFRAYCVAVPISACPYARQAQADDWRLGWKTGELAEQAW